MAAVLACVPATALAALKPQTITFTSTAPGSAVVSGPTYVVTATGGGSGSPVTFKIESTSSSVCSISGSTVTFTGAGTCTIDANQAGGGEFEAAPQRQQSFAVGKGVQTITYTSVAPGSATVGGPTYTVTATGGESHNAVTFAIDASSASVCTISGAIVSFTGAGTCTIDANQVGNANYEAAQQKQQSFAVGKGAQAINYTSTAPSSAIVGGPTYTVTATGGESHSAVTFAIDASSASACTISGAVVSFVGTGTCTIDANQAGNANYEAAQQKQQSFAVGKGTQKITYTTAPGSASVGGPPYSLAATASSALAVTFSSATPLVCTVSGATVRFIGAGTCVIDADQAGNSNYDAAPQLAQSFEVGKGAQMITFTSTPPSVATVGGSPYTVMAEGGGSQNAVTLTIDGPSASVCTISGGGVSFIGEGTCTIDANQAGNADYEAASQQQQSFTVGKGSQTIKFTSMAPSSATVGGPAYTVAATATSGLAVSFSSSTPVVCTVSGTTVSFIGSGTCTIDANQAGNSGYAAAVQVRQSFEVGIAIVLSTPPSTAPIIVHVTPPNSTFKTLGAVFNPTSHMITFTESVAEPGTFSWLLTFQNGKFGVFGRTSAKCKNGFVKLGRKCRPSKIVFARGSAGVTSAGTVTFSLKPTSSALKALKNAYRLKKSLPVAMTLTFQSVRSTSPVSRLLALTVRTR